MKNKNSNKCDDRIINEVRNESKPVVDGCSRPHIRHSEDTRRVSSRPLRRFGVILSFLCALSILLASVLIPLFADKDSRVSGNEVTANALTVNEISPVSYYLVIPANTVFMSVSNWSYNSFYLMSFTVLGNTLRFPIYVVDNTATSGVTYFSIIRSNTTSPPEYSLMQDFYYPIPTAYGDLLYDYSGQLGVNFTIFDFADNIILPSKTSVYPLIVKYNALTDFELNTITNNAYNNGYNQGIQEVANEYYQLGYEEGYQGGYDRGYTVGINSIDFDGNFVGWIIDGVGAFFNFEIFPNFSLGALLGIIISVSVAIWVLKIFAGG